MLTKEQINILYRYFESKGVIYYDLQSELVDHLAENIEKVFLRNDAISFPEAFNESVQQFEKADLKTMVKARKLQQRKLYRKARERYLKSLLLYPSNLFFILLIILLINIPLFYLRDEAMLIYSRYLKLLLVSFIAIVTLIFIYKNLRLKKQRKKLLLSELGYLKWQGVLSYGMYLPIWISSLFSSELESVQSAIFSMESIMLFVFVSLCRLLSDWHAYKTFYFKYKKDYPLAFSK